MNFVHDKNFIVNFSEKFVNLYRPTSMIDSIYIRTISMRNS